MKVMIRVNSCNDLVAVEARYHISCNKKFYSSNISHNDSVSSGRKTDDNKLNAFLQLCNWLDQECDLELYSVGELHRVMETIAGTSDVYHKRYLKQKLIDHYKGQLFFEEVNGKNDVACFRDSVSSIINDKWCDNRKENDEEEAERIVKTAAKLIFRDIRSTKFDKDY